MIFSHDICFNQYRIYPPLPLVLSWDLVKNNRGAAKTLRNRREFFLHKSHLFIYCDKSMIHDDSSSSLNSITSQIIGLAIKVHRLMGPGLLESVYLTLMLSCSRKVFAEWLITFQKPPSWSHLLLSDQNLFAFTQRSLRLCGKPSSCTLTIFRSIEKNYRMLLQPAECGFNVF